MTRVASVLVVFAFLLGASFVAVVQFFDRELVVPPPEAVAEGFVREVITGRYSRAKQYLAEPESTSEEELRVLRERIEAAIGEPAEVEAELVSRTGERALVTVRLSAKERSDAQTYALVFTEEWKISM